MAAVEKRKPPAVALLGNHLMFSVISFFIVLNMGKGKLMFSFGIFFLLLYLFGVYDYSNRDGVEHTKSYSTIEPSYKYPIIYGLIAVSYLLIPALLFIFVNFDLNVKAIIGMFFMFFNAQFLFVEFISVEFINWFILAGFCAVILAFSFLGYYAGTKGFRLAAFLAKYLYVRKKK